MKYLDDSELHADKEYTNFVGFLRGIVKIMTKWVYAHPSVVNTIEEMIN